MIFLICTNKRVSFSLSLRLSLTPLPPRLHAEAMAPFFSQAQEGSEDWGAEAAAGGLAAGGPLPG